MLPVRQGLGNFGPKMFGMIKVRQMAQLVHHYIILQRRRQFNNAVVKTDIAQRRAGAPPRARVADKNFAIQKAVVLVKMLKPRVRQRTRGRRQRFKLGFAFGASSPRLAAHDSPSPDNSEPRHKDRF